MGTSKAARKIKSEIPRHTQEYRIGMTFSLSHKVL